MKNTCLKLGVIVALIAASSFAAADDAHNLCAQPMQPSANVSAADDAVHLDPDGASTFPYEEWYWNTVLAGFGKTYGVQTLVFQFSFFPGAVIDVAQIALTDVATGEYHSQLVWGGGAPFVPSAGYPYVAGGFDLTDTDADGSFHAVGGGGHDKLKFRFDDGTTATIVYEGYKNPSPAFFDGLGHYDDVVTGKSHGTQYYLQRRSMTAFGTIQRPGKLPAVVAGVGWYDRQWGTLIGTPGTQADNTYWKWFALHLSDDTQYTLWDMRAVDTGDQLIKVANRTGAAPACTEKTITDFTVTGLGSPVSSAGPPPSTLENANHISIPSEGLEIDVRMMTPNQVIETGGLFSPFLEGAATITGTKNGRPIFGVGYYEQFVPAGPTAGGCCQGV